MICSNDKATIDRESLMGSALLLSDSGDVLAKFDALWSDDQIRVALDFANEAHSRGFLAGIESAKKTFVKP